MEIRQRAKEGFSEKKMLELDQQAKRWGGEEASLCGSTSSSNIWRLGTCQICKERKLLCVYRMWGFNKILDQELHIY